MRRFVGILVCMLLAVLPSAAQFYTTGQDSGGLRWYRLRTQYYDVLYPRGADSLARVYASELAKWRSPLGSSIGVEPGGRYRRPMPVVLRTQTATANGMVVWTPHRMELYTVPDAYGPESIPWETELAIHEGRHVAQMQVGRQKGFRGLQILAGQLSTGALSALYGGPVLFEGDAVAAETALSASGRGRSADFLEYMMVSADQDQWRNFWQWRYGSLNRNTPDYYRAGYVLVAGMRTTFRDPLFTLKFYDNIHTRPLWFPFFNLQYTVRKDSGMPFRKAWDAIGEDMLGQWREGARARGLFEPVRQVTSTPRHFTQYTGTALSGNGLVSIRTGLYSSPALVSIDSSKGDVTRLRPWASSTSGLQYSSGRIYWSETVPDIRWELKSSSRIRYMDEEGKVSDLTRTGRYYNPAPSPDGSIVSATEYPENGGSAVVLLEAAGGAVRSRLRAPDGLRIVETAWVAPDAVNGSVGGGRLVVSAISSDGAGIYDAGFNTLLAPIHSQIKQLRGVEGRLRFVCDRSGVNELYELQSDGTVVQLSNQRYGGADFVAVSADSLYYSGLDIDGRMIYSARKQSTPVEWVAADWPAADSLSAQEARLAALPTEGGDARFIIPVTERYRRLPHAFRVHSWAPFYADIDDVSSLSFEKVYQSASLGAMAFYQSTLGDAYGTLGYSADFSDGSWRHSGHFKMTYAALWPVIELKADVGGRDRLSYQPKERSGAYTFAATGITGPSFSGDLRIYVPLNFSKGGVYRGLVPQVRWTLSNDIFDTSLLHFKDLPMIGSTSLFRQFLGYDPGHRVPMQKVAMSLRGYAVLGTAPSAIYPRWGIGAEVGYSARAGISEYFNSNTYAFVYGYVPGLFEGHGVKLSALYQHQSARGVYRETYAGTVPRGLSSDALVKDFIYKRYPGQTLLTADYSFASVPMDSAILCPLTYIRNLEFTFHADLGLYSGSASSASSGTLYSLGAQVAMRLGNLLWIPYGTAVGVSYSYNGGDLFDVIASAGRTMPLKRHSFGFVFSVDF